MMERGDSSMKKGIFIGLLTLIVVWILILPASADGPTCSVISGSVGTSGCSHDVQLSWTAQEGSTSFPTEFYQVDRKECGSNTWTYLGVTDVNTLNKIDQNVPAGCYNYDVRPLSFRDYICWSDPITVTVTDTCPPVPEFPSMVLPITMIIGFFGTVLFIQRTREH
jgi:hypothetical protein